MARLSDLPPALARHIAGLPCPTFDTTPRADGPPLSERRVALVTTAGLMRRGDRPFGPGSGDYRVIPGDTAGGDLVMTHVSVNYDRTGFQQDLNVVLPLDRLNEMAADGAIGSVAAFHYSVMGATDPEAMRADAADIVGLLKADGVDAVVFAPV
ncbi:D-proline reductase (dithiol) PrdB [Constrictibacter sp. MBR-5]|jgi:D-proline reductase (dithiol) PrdB|uniref:glycine/sarcosine/betaine reductase selenoprotein B family protein n=1 Tax=Constrictibacter sp. MBR-5 TaxID=3156467 RepID=UPI003398762F